MIQERGGDRRPRQGAARRRCAAMRSAMVMAGMLPALALAGCDGGRTPPPPPRDPVVVAALNDPLMTDPDLLTQAQPGTLFVMPGPASAPIPLIDRGDEELDRARAAAGRLAAPPPLAPEAAPAAGVTLADTMAILLAEFDGPRGCADRIGYTAQWGARLPAAVPIYPRGHLQDAAGSDAPDCRLRAVTFLTPVPAAEVAAFYATRAGQAGWRPRYQRAGEGLRLAARAGATGFAAWLGARDGVTVVTLVTLGL